MTALEPGHYLAPARQTTALSSVATEQGRIYRLAINQRITSAEAARFAYILREIRCSLEAVPEPVVVEKPPMTVSIVTVPEGHFFSENEMRKMSGMPPIHVIEHTPEKHLDDWRAPEPVSEPIVEPPLEYAPRNAHDGAIHHGLHLVKTSREVFEDKLAALPDKTLRALAGVTDEADER